MKRHAVIVAAAAALVFGGQALAQQVAVELAPEQRTTIKSYMVEKKILGIPYKEKLVVGATVSPEVKLNPVPEVWGPSVSKYNYVYTNNNVVLVEPSSRRVVQIIE